jgi:predicted RNA-binding protein YlqC (UPF0109 family)
MSRARDVTDTISRALVDKPDRVEVTEYDEDGCIAIYVKSAVGDLGKLIGRRGRTASAIRTLADITAEQSGDEATVDFEDGEPDQ